MALVPGNSRLSTRGARQLVLYKNGRFTETAEAIVHAIGLGTQGASLYYQFGMINYELVGRTRAQEHLEHALELNPYFPLLQSNIAMQTLAVLNGAPAESIATDCQAR